MVSSDPLKNSSKQINDAQAFARGHDEITNRAALRAGLKNLENSGVFPLALKVGGQTPTDKLSQYTHTKNQHNGNSQTTQVSQQDNDHDTNNMATMNINDISLSATLYRTMT
ncbi:hypothetical protein SEMRO_786_G202190.1 [Seminavis robusta]|uniref:Uncharacterized protein n=1 Tax=Seminavis robusta TaxID=568900 RepID=A0A9N8HJS4_9STRA|nr:hypothetical protein SEMRO_786_G202190.1 [Seminavis robusta]|eukprot:Sro786_g202190.1 n/a (112) ;mRNA; r:986-1321